MKKTVFLLFAMFSIAESWAGEVAVTSVAAQQRYPWDGLVDITVTIQKSAEAVAGCECLFAATNSATKAAIPVEHVTRNGNDTGSGTVWTRKFVWDAKADVGAVKIGDVVLTVDVEIDSGGVQLWENGPYWAECNVGASEPEEYGHYFWWGDAVGYKRNASNNGWISVKDSTSYTFSKGNCPTYWKSNFQLQSAGYIDATGDLVSAHDAATAHLGTPWRMPTVAEFYALNYNCITTWTTRNGVAGLLVTGMGDYVTKSIFLPAAGNGYGSSLDGPGSVGIYWSSSLNSDNSVETWFLEFGPRKFLWGCGESRCDGRSVRPVREFADSRTVIGGVTTHLSLDIDPSAQSWGIVYENLMGAANPNPAQYYEGYETVFSPLGNIANFTFAGWTPSSIPVGSTGPTEGSFSPRDTTKYAVDPLQMRWDGACAAAPEISLNSFAVGTEYHVATVLEPTAGGAWRVTYYKQNASTGVTLSSGSGTMKSGWTLQGLKQTDMVLGQTLTTWDSCSKNSYNELRIWKKAMTEAELTASAKAGPDAEL